MREEFIITTSSKRAEGEEVDTRRDCLTVLQSELDLGLEFSWHRCRMLCEEFEDIVPNEFMTRAIGCAKEFNNALRIVLDVEVVILDH